MSQNTDIEYLTSKQIEGLIAQREAEVKSLDPEDPANVERLAELNKEILKYEKKLFDPNMLDKELVYLLSEDSFLGTVSQKITKKADWTMPTAYVGIRHFTKDIYNVVMGYNPAFFRKLSPRQRKGVIVHELYHVIFMHIFQRAVSDKKLAVLHNWATDLAINSLIGEDHLPSIVLMPGKRNKDPRTGKAIEGPYADFIANAPPLKASDWYYSELLKIYQENDDGSGNSIAASGIGTLDDHEGWKEVPADILEEIRNEVEAGISEAVRKADGENSWGNTPAHIQAWIRKMLSKEVDWRSILHNFIGRVRSMERSSTLKRINKKAPYVFPGVRRKTKATFACFIDQSGSMSDKDVAQMFGELENLARETEIDVFHFDTEVDVDSHTVWKKSQPFPKPHRTRCGGTDFNAVARYCNDQKNPNWSGVIILTDGYAPVMGAINNAKVLWVITEGGTREHIRPGDLVCQMKQDSGQFKPY